ncbi:hypothetical protein HY968_05205 [Candidatus Kaiserbacteria bacterium]|nr:hypothetical protein [Candidatus Kaiserbacteria bacterium]
MMKLDEIAINIELVLVSLIEGVALVTLAEHAAEILHGPDALVSIPYILAGLAIILAFWSQSILHAVSFIRWPVRVEHMFLYFVAGFIQVIAYTNIDAATAWFFWWSIFTLVALLMYALDLRIIRESRARFPAVFLAEVERRHIYEMKYLVPIALVFNAGALAFAFFFPETFSTGIGFFVLGSLQLLISLLAIYDCTKNFRDRSAMIAKLNT